MRVKFIIKTDSPLYFSSKSPYIYCDPKLSSMLTYEGVEKIVRFSIKHEFDYYHNVKIYEEIFNKEKI